MIIKLPLLRLRKAILGSALLVAFQSAHAGFMPVYTGQTPSGPNFVFNYTLNFTTSSPGGPVVLNTNDYLTIYDVAGLLGATASAGFSVSLQNIGITPPLIVPNDDPALTNVTFTYTGAPVLVDTVFSGFSIISNFGFTASDNYGSIYANVTNGTRTSEVGFVLVPSASPTGGPGPNVPDGGSTVGLLGIALCGVALLRRKLA